LAVLSYCIFFSCLDNL